MVHARRKFKDAFDQKQKGSDEAMDMFGELYAIEGRPAINKWTMPTGWN